MTTKFQLIVIDKDGNPWGPFDTPEALAAFAKRKWPDQDERPEGAPQSEGWRAMTLRAPE
jgi:hypothetical protein